MSLVSLTFFLMVAISLVMFYIVPKKLQWIVLLLTSIVFFCCVGTPWTIVYPIAATLVTWWCALLIKKNKENDNGKKAKGFFIIGVLVDVSLLAVLKYLNFFLANAGIIYSWVSKQTTSWSLDIVAALGISFYTLQIVGYLADCYWGIVEPQRNIGKFALFSMFFPQMVSGPISRYDQLGKQLFAEHKFQWENIRIGVFRVVIGIFKKLVLAENISLILPYFLKADSGVTGPIAFAGMIGYVVQIYADFSGCMDIVIGVANCFDIKMVENFNYPFLSRSIQEFWQRWHITLGLWLRDYIMYPLLRSKTWKIMTKFCKKRIGKTASKKIPTHIAMLILWICMGLWHGGWWNFILEGVWFWLVIVIGDWCDPLFKKVTSKFNTENKIWMLFQRIRTTLIYAIGAIMFKCGSVKESFIMLRNIFSPLWVKNISGVKEILVSFLNEFGKWHFIGVALVILCSWFVFLGMNKIVMKHGNVGVYAGRFPVLVRIMFIAVIVYLILIFGVYGPGYNASDFIYGGF